MTAGLFSGFMAALLQSSSYLCSKKFIQKNGTAFQLAVYSQLVMGICCIITLIPFWKHFQCPVSWESVWPLVITVIFYWLGQVSFFRALAHIEASRLSSLLGLKILILPVLSILIFGSSVSLRQWTAVILCSSAAVGMNFAGVRINRYACFWLFSVLCCFSLSDVGAAGMVQAVQSDSWIIRAVAATAISYLALGICAAVLLAFCSLTSDSVGKKLNLHWSLSLLTAAIPFGLAWFFAMLFLYHCFGVIGVVYGTIVQASRGFISVILGLAVAKFGFLYIEPKASPAIWIRRFIMAVLMIVSIALYRT